MSYRVVYGETIPAWEQTFPTKRKAETFARRHRAMGDIVFSVAKVVPGEGPKSLTALIETSQARAIAERSP